MASYPNSGPLHDSPPWAPIAIAAAAAPVGLLIADHTGNVVVANAEAGALLKLNESAVGQPINALFNSSDSEVRQVLVGCIRNGTPFRGRMMVMTLDGDTVDCDFAAYRVEAADGAPAYCAVWLNDVTEHAAMQRSLLQAERLSSLGEIVAGVAHELNNPLTGILGYAQLLVKDDHSEKTRQRLENIVAEAMRCQAIVQSLRGFSSHAVTEKGVHDVNQIVDNMVTLLEYQMRVDNIDVRRELTPNGATMLVDAHELGRAILNIVHNAHQALGSVPEGARTFTVASEANDDEVLIRFRDNGPGIARENLPRIFDPFFTTREFGAGVGLGLSVAYGVVREHGGRIEVHSAPGEGAEFVIHLPRRHA